MQSLKFFALQVKMRIFKTNFIINNVKPFVIFIVYFVTLQMCDWFNYSNVLNRPIIQTKLFLLYIVKFALDNLRPNILQIEY